MLEKDFESRRQDLFVRASQESLARCDPKDGIIHSVKYAGKDHSMHSRAAGYDIRAMAEAACAWMMSGNETRANLAIELILKNQDMNPDSLTWGNFKWHSDWPLALDPNAVSFIVPQLWYLDKYAGAKINPELRIKLHTALRNACDAIMAHCCTFLYTNIVLLNLASLLCIADRLDWERPRLLAAWAFEEWRNRIGHLGTLPEYNC
ncbi:MAG: hypothetical protein WCT05_14045, partial [Lentisphaeria bacterium]